MPNRIVIVGSSCCGKTTFAKRLATLLQIPHIELDALHWGPNWQARPLEEFRRLVTEAVSPPPGEPEASAPGAWLIDGNYSIVRDLFWSNATQIIWLNYSFPTIFGRALKRSLSRSLTGERLYSGNRESFYRNFFHRDSVIWWMIKTFRRRRRALRALREENIYPNLVWTELRTPAAAERFLQDARGKG